MRILLVILGGVIIPFAVMALYSDWPEPGAKKTAPCVKIENHMKVTNTGPGQSTSEIKLETCDF